LKAHQKLKEAVNFLNIHHQLSLEIYRFIGTIFKQTKSGEKVTSKNEDENEKKNS
jgi:hypothetical protein